MLMLGMASFTAAEPLRLKEADNGKTNSVAAGAEIEIILAGNPTTGYAWELNAFSTNSLQKIGDVQYRQTEFSDRMPRVGVGGSFSFKFKAVQPGKSDIKLIYRRSWETTVHEKVYSAVIEVK
jgi:inhibitor of cysteine peptidase